MWSENGSEKMDVVFIEELKMKMGAYVGETKEAKEATASV